MIKYISFTYNKHIYATCYGIDPFAAAKCPYANIFDPSAAGRGELRCFTSLVGGNEYTLPRLQDVEITVADTVAKFMAGKGWTEVAGVRYNIVFDSNGIQCFDPNGVDINAVIVETDTAVPEEKTDVKEEPTTVAQEPDSTNTDSPVTITDETVVEASNPVSVPVVAPVVSIGVVSGDEVKKVWETP